MPAYAIYGDSFLVPRRLSELEAETGAKELLESNRHYLQGGQAKSGELLSMCGALPFMDPYRLVVVEGLLGKGESQSGGRGRGRSRRSNANSGATGATEWQALSEAIPQMPDTTILIFIDGPLTANNSMLRLLKPVCQAEELSAPAGEALARWIRDTAIAKGAAINPAAIRSLTGLVGNDLWTLEQELEKLSLYATGREINERDVGQMVSQVREASIFAAVDAMIDGRPAVALRLLHRLKEDGREATYIIGMVERQLRLLALARNAMDQGVSQRDLGARLGGAADFVVRKTADQARKHSWQDIVWRYNRLLETDLAIKQGRLEPDLALELLVGEQAAAR